MQEYNPEQAMWKVRREFGEHGGVSPSISRSSTFTVLDPCVMPEIFEGLRGPDKGGCFLYSRHFNPTLDVLGRYLHALEGTEAALCTASGMAGIAGLLRGSSMTPTPTAASTNAINGARTAGLGAVGGASRYFSRLGS